MPHPDIVTPPAVPHGDPEAVLRDELSMLLDGLLDQMLETGMVEPACLQLVAGATATLAALDRRQQKEPA